MKPTWNALPFRKILERLLWQQSGESLGRGSLKYPSRFKPGAKKYLLEEIEKLPPGPIKSAMRKSIPLLPCPKELVLQTYLLGATAKSTPRYEDIMCDKEVCDLIQISGMLSLPLNLLWSRLNQIDLGLGEHLKRGDIEKFQYFFWNTAEKDGWSYTEKHIFQQFLGADEELSSGFERLLKYGFGAVRLEVAMEYGFSLTPEGRKNNVNLLADNILSAAIMAAQKGVPEQTGVSVQNLSRVSKILKDLNIEYDIQKDQSPENALKMLRVHGTNDRAG